jgi:hypothetical protein
MQGIRARVQRGGEDDGIVLSQQNEEKKFDSLSNANIIKMHFAGFLFLSTMFGSSGLKI